MTYFVGSTSGIAHTGLNYIDGIRWGSRWNTENDGGKLTYSFVNDQTWDNGFFSAEETTFHSAMQSWANVANIRLEFSGYNDHNAEITFHSIPGDVIGGALGLSNPPGESISGFYQGDIMISRDAYQSNPSGELRVGSYDYMTYVHEIGHALGLAHPHDDGGTSTIFPGVYSDASTGNFGLNQYVWTVMSYVDTHSSYSSGYDTNWGYIGGPMAFDIAAIQSLYGVNTTYNTGNNTYYLPTLNGAGTYWSSIWDSGGVDTISGQNASKSVVINLNNASLANGDPNAGGLISQVSGIKGGFTIAKSQGGLGIIENAIGGSGNDTLTGNNADNSFSGGSGDDTLLGGGGNDSLNGGTGRDMMTGGAGNDTYYIDNLSDIITEKSFEGTDTVQSSITLTLGTNVENLILTGSAAINGTGNSSGNSVTGNSANNTLYGGYGADILYGGTGNDTLDGGTATTYDTSNDTLYGELGDDVLWGGKGFDYLDGGSGSDWLSGWLGNDKLTGGSGSDFFIFNSFNDGIDSITDFSTVFDTIGISAAGFGGGLIANSSLVTNQFYNGIAATTADHRFIYNANNGALYFDQDGIGLTGQIQIATISSGLAMTNNDIYII